ncbi:MAG: hypothetical protein HZB65_03145 [Candidatus Aenigmarchaeota archaeon]|nr:hypothetical protein [Candidatus Aenigmarchaeota archaeon]
MKFYKSLALVVLGGAILLTCGCGKQKTVPMINTIDKYAYGKRIVFIQSSDESYPNVMEIYDRGLFDASLSTGADEDKGERTLDIIVNYRTDEVGDSSQDRVYRFDNIGGSQSFTMLSPKALLYYELPDEYAGTRHENSQYCNLTKIGKDMWLENWNNLLEPISDRPARTKRVIEQRKNLLEEMLIIFTKEYDKYKDALISQ